MARLFAEPSRPQEFDVTEAQRLAAVRRYDILDTPPDGAFDRITAIAARLLNVPIAIVSIVDHDRIWFKSRHGVDVPQLDRDPGLCASCILQDGPWIISDARTDVRTLANPLVAGAAGIQFYLGIPLKTHDGFNLGTLCVLDTAPRTPSKTDVAQLGDLAAVVMDEIELRLAAKKAVGDYHDELVRRELREDHIKGLMRELAHRSKNLLSVVQALTRQTMPDDATSQRYAARLGNRIQALAHTHDLIAEEEWRGAKLDELVRGQVTQFVGMESPRVELAGPSLMVTPAAAQNIGLALHELASNAAQHGRLMAPDSHVSFAWQIEERLPAQRWLHMTWRERSGSPVQPPRRKGFGHLVLERLAPEGLGGTARLIFEGDGVIWSCETPSSRIVS
jgi:two-component sensor histidine kinase